MKLVYQMIANYLFGIFEFKLTVSAIPDWSSNGVEGLEIKHTIFCY